MAWLKKQQFRVSMCHMGIEESKTRCEKGQITGSVKPLRYFDWAA